MHSKISSNTKMVSAHFLRQLIPRLIWAAGYFLFFLMLFAPTSYVPLKAGLLMFVTAAVGFDAIATRRIGIHPTLLIWTVLLTVVSLSFMWLGLVNGGPGSFRVGTVYVLWPFIYLVLVSTLQTRLAWERIFSLMVLATVLIAGYSASFLLTSVGLLPASFYISLDLGQAIGIYDGYVEYNLHSVSTLLFLVPFLISLVLTLPRNCRVTKRVWIWVACFSGIGIALLSGRRALWLVVALAPVLVFAGRLFLPRSLELAGRESFLRSFAMLALLGGLVVAISGHFLGIEPTAVVTNLLEGFDFSTESQAASATIRSDQFSGLLAAWQEYPVLGVGHGMGLPGIVRSAEMPWAFELSYMSLLYQTGIVGFLFYSAGVTWLFYAGFMILRSGHWSSHYVFSMLIGTLSFLIANATNPYLAKYDFLWVLFLPAAIINLWLLERRSAAGSLPA